MVVNYLASDRDLSIHFRASAFDSIFGQAQDNVLNSLPVSLKFRQISVLVHFEENCHVNDKPVDGTSDLLKEFHRV